MRSAGRRAGRRAVLLLVVLAGAAPSCARQRFAATFESPEALAREVLRAVESRDLARLQSLALSEAEFRDEVYPEMPAARAIPYTVPWEDLRQKSAIQIAALLRQHGGRGYDLRAVGFDGARTAYRTFVVHRRPRLTVTDRTSGRREVLAPVGSVLECDGRYKLFSFVVSR